MYSFMYIGCPCFSSVLINAVYWVRKLQYNFSDHWELFKNFYINNDTPLAASTLTNFRFETADIFFPAIWPCAHT